MKRTDIHRPSAINPEEYAHVACLVQTDEMAWPMLAAEREIIRQHMAATGGKWASHDHGGNCHVCGAWCVDEAIWYHAPSNEYIRTGFDCAEKLFTCDARRFRDFRKARKAASELKAGKLKARDTLETLGLGFAWGVWEASQEAYDGRFEESTITDMVGKLIRYGSLSDRQISFMGKLVDKIQNRAQVAAERAAEHAAADPVVTGKGVRITGEILSLRVEFNPYSYYGKDLVKMLVGDDRGFKVWGTRPAALSDAGMGDRIEFVANVEVSDDDIKFGFFKRPRGAAILEKAAA